MSFIQSVNFKTKLVKRGKEDHYTLIKGQIQREEIIIINIYAPNYSAPNFNKLDTKYQININTIIVEYLNIPLSQIDISTRSSHHHPKKNQLQISELNTTPEQILNKYLLIF